jgi:hypothetical protein
VEADNGHPAAASKRLDCLGKRPPEAAQLIVDRDAKRLEDAGGRMDPPWARGRHGTANDVGELFSAADGRAAAFRNDTLSDSSSESLLTVFRKDPLQLQCRQFGDQIRGGLLCTWPETHVQWCVLLEAKAALRPIELRGAYAQVEKDAIRRLKSISWRQVCQPVEVGLYEKHAIPKRLQATPRCFHGSGIGIDSQQETVWAGQLEKPLRMTAPAESSVDVSTAGPRLERCYGFGEKNGCMRESGSHTF